MNFEYISYVKTITPFYLILDKQTIIIEAGITILAIEPDAVGKSFFDVFKIDGQNDVNPDLKILTEICCVRAINTPIYLLEGHFNISATSNIICFVGAPDWETYQYLIDFDMPITKFWQYVEPKDVIPVFKMREEMVHKFLGIKEHSDKQQKELEKEKIKYLEVIDTLDEVIFQTDNDGNWVFLNKAWEKIMGFTVSESINTLLFNYLHPDDVQKNWDLFLPLINKEKTYCSHRIRYITKSNKIKWIRVYAKLIIDENNETQGTAGTLLDVTKEMENEQMLSLILENIKDEVALIDENQHYIFASPSLLKNRGFKDLKELNQNRLRQNVHLDDIVGLFEELSSSGLKEKSTEHRIDINNEFYWYNERFSKVTDKTSDIHYMLVVSRNIHQRKLLEQKLELITDNISEEITMFDLKGNYLYASPSAIKNRGFSDFEKMKRINAFSKFDSELANTILKNLEETGKCNIEGKFELRKNKKIWYEINSKLITDKTDGFQYVLAVSRNIEERKRDEQKLEMIANNIADEITMFDLNGQYFFASQSAIVNRGYKDFEEMKNFNAFDLYNSKTDAKQYLAEIKKHGIINGKGKLKLSNGKSIWYEASAKLIIDNFTKKEYIVAVSRNISERLNYEKQLELITANTSDEITMFNLEGEYLFASPSAIKNRGCESFEDMKKVNVFSRFKEGVKDAQLHALHNNEYVDFEGLYMVKNGEYKWYEATSKLVKDEYDNRYIISVARNIEERKKQEAQLKANLKKEKELNEFQSNFIATSSHEFKTPLAIIKNSLEILKSSEYTNKKKVETSFLDKYFSRIDNEVNKVIDLINDTLLLENANHNLLKTTFLPTDLSYILMQIVEQQASIFEGRPKIRIKVTNTPQRIVLDQTLIRHAFENIISNALKYSKGKPNPEVALIYNKENVEVFVKDFGIGIPPESMNNIGKPFFRAKNTASINGTGMGLSIVFKIFEAHKADIKIDSVLNEGTTVTIKIPYTR